MTIGIEHVPPDSIRYSIRTELSDSQVPSVSWHTGSKGGATVHPVTVYNWRITGVSVAKAFTVY